MSNYFLRFLYIAYRIAIAAPIIPPMSAGDMFIESIQVYLEIEMAKLAHVISFS